MARLTITWAEGRRSIVTVDDDIMPETVRAIVAVHGVERVDVHATEAATV